MTSVSAPENKWLVRVRALLNKAEDPASTPEEAEALTAKATELMAKYGIGQALANARAEKKQTPADRIFDLSGAYARERANLLGWIATELRCRSVVLTLRQGRRKVGLKLHVFGYQTDLDRVDLLYTSLLVQMVNGLAKAQKPLFEDTAAFRRSWMVGFASEVSRRIGEVENRAQQDSDEPGVDLVLADRSTQVDQATKAVYPTVPPPKRRVLSGSGRAAGALAGRNADIGNTRIESAANNALTSA